MRRDVVPGRKITTSGAWTLLSSQSRESHHGVSPRTSNRHHPIFGRPSNRSPSHAFYSFPDTAFNSLVETGCSDGLVEVSNRSVAQHKSSMQIRTGYLRSQMR